VEKNKQRFGEDVFLWERSHMEASTLKWEKTVVCGHTPQPDPVNRERLIAIDTGCVYNMHPGLGRLTAVQLPEREFVSVAYADG
jgi:serine/threonine protein phosphatase 1